MAITCLPAPRSILRPTAQCPRAGRSTPPVPLNRCSASHQRPPRSTVRGAAPSDWAEVAARSGGRAGRPGVHSVRWRHRAPDRPLSSDTATIGACVVGRAVAPPGPPGPSCTPPRWMRPTRWVGRECRLAPVPSAPRPTVLSVAAGPLHASARPRRGAHMASPGCRVQGERTRLSDVGLCRTMGTWRTYIATCFAGMTLGLRISPHPCPFTQFAAGRARGPPGRLA